MMLQSRKTQLNSVSKLFHRLDDHSTSNSQDDDDDYNVSVDDKEIREKPVIQSLIDAKKKRLDTTTLQHSTDGKMKGTTKIDDIWKNNSSEYKPASPHYVLSQFGKKVSKAIIKKMIDYDEKLSSATSNLTPEKVQNKYAVTPFKLPKTNISRLEVAFQDNSRQSFEKVSHSRKSNMFGDTDDDINSSDDCSIEMNDIVKDDVISGCDGKLSVGRLAGGADKCPRTSSSSVSDTETLVGEESMCRLACNNQ